jgi:flagellar motor switch protein FliG
MAEEQEDKSLVERLEFLEHKLGVHYVPEADKALEALLETLEPLALQGLLRELDAKELELALLGLGPKALAQVKAAMSKKSWEMILDDVGVLLRQGVTQAAVHEARLKVMAVAQRSLGQGSGSEAGKKLEGLEAWKKDVLDKLG